MHPYQSPYLGFATLRGSKKNRRDIPKPRFPGPGWCSICIKIRKKTWYPRGKKWLMVYLPLWKIWVRQLGWWHSQYMESLKIHVPTHQPVIRWTTPVIMGTCDHSGIKTSLRFLGCKKRSLGDFLTVIVWLVVLTILKKLLVNGKDYPIYYGK